MRPLPTEHAYHYLYTDVSQIKDEHLLALFREIVDLRKEELNGFVVHFLTQSLHPFATYQKKKPFDKSEVFLKQYLPMKIGKLKDTEIYNLSLDLIFLSKLGHIENFYGTALYVLINKAIPDKNKRKKKH